MLEFLKDNSLWLLLAAGTVFNFVWLGMHKNKVKMNVIAIAIIGILHTLLGLLSVKVFAVIESFDFSNMEATSLFGGIFFMPLLYFAGAKLFKRNIAAVYDLLTPCMIFTVMLARVNCIISGCCKGLEIPGTDFRYPTRELEVIFYIALLVYLFIKEGKKTKEGLFYPFYMLTYGVFRFVVEFFRVSSNPSFIHLSHFWAIISFLIGLTFYLELKKDKNKKNHR